MNSEIPGGYSGKILRVNLSNKKISIERPDGEFYRKYVGGAGFTSYYLLNELQPGIDPLGPDNKLIFALGPLTGYALPGSGRNAVGAKSPLTGGIAKSEVGGFWGAELKRAGFDAIIIEGKAQNPVYLYVNDGEVSIRDASSLWGKNTRETGQSIRDELGDKLIRVASIGPGGEHLVRYACIMNGLYDAAGRGGLGAVMGSKNLKAVCVRGHNAPEIKDREGLKEVREWLLANEVLVASFHEFGTGSAMPKYEASGNLPVRNFRDGLFPEVKMIDATTVRDTIRVKMDACFGCPVRCKKVVKVTGSYSVDPAYGGPEYETLASLGSNCGISDLKAVAKGNELCGAYSLDTISTGAVISFAMECFENGLLSAKDTNGIELKFGNAKAMLEIIELIAHRQGIGNILAEGTLRASQEIGKGAIQYAMQVKGLEPGMHEPRAKPGLGLGYMVNPHGADHCCNLHDDRYFTDIQLGEMKSMGIEKAIPLYTMNPSKVALFRLVQLKRIIFDSLVICQFLPYSFEHIASATAAVTGWDTGVNEQLKVAERILTMQRLFNIREGFTVKDDILPDRFFSPKTDGELSDKPLNRTQMEKAKRYYYVLMGWNAETGIPISEKLEELGIA
jgi:aldehyde:ferredoxin oxidoreductase